MTLALTTPIDIEGIYQVRGDQGSTQYNGICVIRQLDTDSFFIVNTCGKTVTQGIGLRTGEHLAVSWTNGPAMGVTLYKISGKTLTGRWTQVGEIHREQLTFLSPIPDDV